MKVSQFNQYVYQEDYATLKIHSPTHGDFDVLIDLDDVERCKLHKWCVMRTYHRDNVMYYIRSNQNGKAVMLHRFIIGETRKGYVADHVDGDTMNNRKLNLRSITQHENTINRVHENKDSISGYRGVLWYTHCKTPKWVAHIWLNGERTHLGYFENLEDAIAARKKAEEKYFGELSR